MYGERDRLVQARKAVVGVKVEAGGSEREDDEKGDEKDDEKDDEKEGDEEIVVGKGKNRVVRMD